MRNNTEEVRVIRQLQFEALYTRPGTDEQVSVLNTTEEDITLSAYWA